MIAIPLIIIIMYLLYVIKIKNNELENTNTDKYISKIQQLENEIENLRSYKHDIKNHFNTITTFLENNQNVQANEYINSLSFENQYFATGNTEVNSILNSKIKLMQSLNINREFDIALPNKMNIQVVDLNVILTNLLDNAIRVTKKCDDKKIIVKMKYTKSNLIIYIENTYKDEVIIKNNNLITTKKDEKNHGIGIKNVKNIVNKYKGNIEIKAEQNIFSVFIMLEC